MEPKTVAGVLKLLQKRPQDAELYQLLGKLYLKAGRYKEAHVAYEHSLAIDPNDAFTHLYLGNWFFHVGKPQKALSAFKRTAKLMPEQAIVHTCQGDIYKAQGQNDLAEKAYKTAVRVAPDDKQARQKLSQWYEFRDAKGEASGPRKRKRRTTR